MPEPRPTVRGYSPPHYRWSPRSLWRTRIMNRVRASTSAQPVAERTELHELIGLQLALLVGGEEHLEHDAAIDVEEHDQRGELSHERAFQERKPAASFVSQMAMEHLLTHPLL